MSKATGSQVYRYSLTEEGFRIVNGGRYFNRPLYGTHARDKYSVGDSVLVVAGDMPQVMSVLLHAQHGGKGGMLSFGLICGDRDRWLDKFDQITTTYEPGLISYVLKDSIIGEGEITLDVVPLIEAEGYIVRMRLEGIAESAKFIWVYGGISAFGHWRSHLDYGCLEQGGFDLKDYAGNVFEIEDATFRLSAPAKNPGKVFQGACSFQGSYHLADAAVMPKGPQAVLASEGTEHPVLAGCSEVNSSVCEGYIVVIREAEGEPGAEAYLAKPDRTFDRCVSHYKGIARQVTIETPDRYLNKGMEALCLAMDACWHHPTFMHGTWSWHEPYLGWRNWYGPSVLGWHDRVRTAIRAHAATQIKQPESLQPEWSEEHGFASGGDSRGGLPSMLCGEITHVFYNMVEVYLDHIFYHYQWTGDLDFMREIFPVIADALTWERRTFDADDDGLYENYLNTWISDAHWYNGGGCIQSSAYNYRANLLAAEVAERLGVDSGPFQKQAEKIKRAANEILWLAEKGIYAEYKDVIGHRRLHESPELASVYHPIDFYLTDQFQAYQMLRFTEYGLVNECKTPRGGRLVWSSAWEPPLYSSRGLYPEEILNTLLCYYRIGQVEEAQALLNGCAASWYMGPVPGAIDHNIKPNGEQFGSTDFSDTVSMFCRCIVEGLFGILPCMQDKTVTIMPGFPRRWRRAKISTPDIAYQYERQGLRETLRATTPQPTKKILRIIARWDAVRSVRLNGQAVEFELVPGIGHAYIVVEAPVCRTAEFEISYRRIPRAKVAFSPVAAWGEQYNVEVKGGEIKGVNDPQGVLEGVKLSSARLEGKVKAALGHHTFFVSIRNGDLSYWAPVDVEVRQPIEIIRPRLELSDSRPTYSFSIRNNVPLLLVTDFTARFAGQEIRDKLQLEPYATSGAFAYPVHNLELLSQGQNPVEVSFSDYPFAPTGTATVWDLTETLPELGEGLSARFCPIPLDDHYNDNLEEIHQHEYRTPRPSTYSIMTKLDGRPMWDGNLWGYGRLAVIDDSNLRGKTDPSGVYLTKVGIPFRQVGQGKNVAVVSIWDSFPTSISIPVNKKAGKLYLLIAGSTHPMQSQIANGRVTVRYEDGVEQTLDLVNPQNFDDLICAPYHHQGATEPIGNNTHAIVLDMVLLRDKLIKEIELCALSNEVLVGFLGVTLLV